MSQLVNAEVNSKAVPTSNYTLKLRIRGRHAGMECDLNGIKHCSHCVWFLRTRKINRINKKAFQAACIPGTN